MTAEKIQPETTNPPPTQHTFQLTVEVDGFWIDYLTKHNDIFMRNYAGYWLRSIEFDTGRGWLCWEDDEEYEHEQELDLEAALAAWKSNEPLPARWFRLDRAMALRAWEEGVKRWGVDWYEDVDAQREDVVVQLAMLGEIRYG